MKTWKVVFVLVMLCAIVWQGYPIFFGENTSVEEGVDNKSVKGETIPYIKIKKSHRELYETIPYLLWGLNLGTPTSSQIDQEIRRIQRELNNKPGVIENKYVWIKNTLPITGEKNNYKFDFNKYKEMFSPGTLASVIPTNIVFNIVDADSNQLDKLYEHYKEQAIIDLFDLLINESKKNTVKFITVKIREETDIPERLNNGSLELNKADRDFISDNINNYIEQNYAEKFYEIDEEFRWKELSNQISDYIIYKLENN